MTEESDVVGFLRDHDGQASLDQISEGLDIAKYGPKSAYALLQSLRSKNVVARKGEMWVLVAPEEAAKPAQREEEAEVEPEVERVMKAMAKTLAEAMKGARAPADE